MALTSSSSSSLSSSSYFSSLLASFDNQAFSQIRFSNKPICRGQTGDEYIFMGELGYGFGRNVCRNNCGHVFVIKLLKKKSFNCEIDVLKSVNSAGCFHFPKLHDYGECAERYFIILTFLGNNLRCLLNSAQMHFDSGFSKETCLAIGIQTLNAIEELHYCGFISRDIKPENFLCGRLWPDTGNIYMIDFSTARRFLGEDGHHLDVKSRYFTGTVQFCSIAQQQNELASRVDDLEAWLYSLIYLFNGSLDWYSLRRNEFDKILKLKNLLRHKTVICKGIKICRKFPQMMSEMLKIIDSTSRFGRPYYNKLYNLMETEMKILDCSLDRLYDWELWGGLSFCGYGNSVLKRNMHCCEFIANS